MITYLSGNFSLEASLPVGDLSTSKSLSSHGLCRGRHPRIGLPCSLLQQSEAPPFPNLSISCRFQAPPRIFPWPNCGNIPWEWGCWLSFAAYGCVSELLVQAFAFFFRWPFSLPFNNAYVLTNGGSCRPAATCIFLIAETLENSVVGASRVLIAWT